MDTSIDITSGVTDDDTGDDTNTEHQRELLQRKENRQQINTCLSDFCRIENIVAKYIYNKYIDLDEEYNEDDDNVGEIVENTDTGEIVENTDTEEIVENTGTEEIVENTDTEEIVENTDTEEIVENTDTVASISAMSSHEIRSNIYSRKAKNEIKYKIYLDTIFQKSKKGIITQGELLTTELNNLAIAEIKLDDMKATALVKHQNITCNTRFMRSSVKSFPDMMRCGFIIKQKNKLHRCGYKVISNDCEYCSMHALMPNIYWDRYCNLVEKYQS